MATSLTVSAAIEALREECAALAQAEQAVVTLRANRDDLIRDAASHGISDRRLGSVTGLSRDRLWRIKNGGQGTAA